MSTRRTLAFCTAIAVVSVLAPAGTATARPAEHPAAVTASMHAEPRHVIARRQHADGTTSVSIYRVAAGFSADQLYAKLKAQGVEGLVDPGTVQPLDVYQCYYGTAYALESGKCPPIRWRWNGYSDPQVYFRDHTPSQWPVIASVSKWHEAVGIDSYWISGSSSCPGGGRHCVNVYSGNYGSGWYGRTSYRYDSSRYFIDGSVKVELNDYYSSPYDNRGTTCHELGHALGLGHNMSTGSCMYHSSVSGTDPMYPNASDYGLLRYVIYP